MVQQKQISDRLQRFESETGIYIIIDIYPSLAGERLEDFTARTANAWAASRRENQKGVALFLFITDRRSRIEVGRGLKNRLTDEFCQHVLDVVMRPKLRASDYGGAIEAGIGAMMVELRRPPGAS